MNELTEITTGLLSSLSFSGDLRLRFGLTWTGRRMRKPAILKSNWSGLSDDQKKLVSTFISNVGGPS